MPATPPPSRPAALPFAGDDIPTCSSSDSRHFQQAARHSHRLEHYRGSPELRRVPSTSAFLLDDIPPPPPPPVPVTFNGQQFNNLPSHIAAAVAALSLETSSEPSTSAHFPNNIPTPPASAAPLAPTSRPLRSHAGNAQLLPVSVMFPFGYLTY